MEDWSANRRFARYRSFRLGDENDSFRMYHKNLFYGNAGDSLSVGFVSMRTGQALVLNISGEGGGTLKLRTDDMTLAGDVIQDLAAYLTLESV